MENIWYKDKAYGIKSVIIHPNYKITPGYKGRDYNLVDEDICVLKLKRRLKFTTNVKPACLPPKPSFNPQSRAIVSGWGSTVAGMYCKVASINTS